MNFLTDQERAQLKSQHKQERDGRVRDRIKAILLYDEGWTSQQIAKVLLISDQAVRNHVDEYKASNKLILRRNFPRNNPKSLRLIYKSILIST
jgi:predicted ArsR family transcriptional regulator